MEYMLAFELDGDEISVIAAIICSSASGIGVIWYWAYRIAGRMGNIETSIEKGMAEVKGELKTQKVIVCNIDDSLKETTELVHRHNEECDPDRRVFKERFGSVNARLDKLEGAK